MQDADMADSINPADGPSTASPPPAVVPADVKDAGSSGGGDHRGGSPRGAGTWSMPLPLPLPLPLPSSNTGMTSDVHEVVAQKEVPAWATVQPSECTTPAAAGRHHTPLGPVYRRVRDVRYSPYGHYLRITNMRPADYLHTARERLVSQIKQPTFRRSTKPGIRFVYPNPNPGPSQGSLERYSRPQSRPPSTPVVFFDSPEHGPFFIPLLQPPINRHTLKELDVETILVNPQLRHDLVSDSSLQFRPTTSRQKRQANDNYWYSIKQELERGCTCLVVDTKYRYHLHDCTCTKEEKEAQLPYSTIRFAGPSSKCPENVWVVRTPSRIPFLIEELREILVSVTAPSKVPVHGSCLKCMCNHDFVPRSSGGHEPWLVDSLDVALIGQEVKHGLFNFTGLLVAIGAMLGRYCAPTRDPVVKAMVEMVNKPAESGAEKILNVVSAIRMCFEIVEMMKLDLTNHQLLVLRPLLLETAPSFEVMTFHKATIPTTITRPWLKASFNELESKPDLVSSLTSRSLRELLPYDRLSLALQTALADIIFFPPSAPPTAPPPLPTTMPVSVTTPRLTLTIGYPETFHLDQAKLYCLTSLAADFTALYMLLMLFRFLASAPAKESLPGRPVIIKPEDLESIKQEITSICPNRLGLYFYTTSNQPITTPDKPTKTFSEQFGAGTWSDTMENVILQIALRADQARSGIPLPADDEARKASAATNSPPNAALLDLARGWCTSHLRADSPLCSLFRQKVRDAVLQASANCHVPFTPAAKIGNNAITQCGSDDAMTIDTMTEAALTTPVPTPTLSVGLEPFSNEITNLGRRLYKITELNLRVYAQLYFTLDLFS